MEFGDVQLPPRFWKKVQVFGTCWQWTGYKDKSGYGIAWVTKKPCYAHRATAALVGKLKAGKEIDHLCKNRGCVNPDHLESVTHKVNMERSTPATKPLCRKGHPLFTIIGRKHRICRVCLNHSSLRSYKRGRGFGLIPNT